MSLYACIPSRQCISSYTTTVCIRLCVFFRLPFIKVVTEERVWNFAPDEPEQLDYWFDAFEYALQPYM